MLTVDVHHHILPDFFWRETNEQDGPVGGIAPPPWSKQSALAFMDDAGIDVAVTSISTPGVHMGDNVRARSLARRCNELAAELVQARPGLPIPPPMLSGCRTLCSTSWRIRRARSRTSTTATRSRGRRTS